MRDGGSGFTTRDTTGLSANRTTVSTSAGMYLRPACCALGGFEGLRKTYERGIRGETLCGYRDLIKRLDEE
jgi:hypothetical protein